MSRRRYDFCVRRRHHLHVCCLDVIGYSCEGSIRSFDHFICFHSIIYHLDDEPQPRHVLTKSGQLQLTWFSVQVFEGLFSGAVPVYRGANTIHRFMPSNDSFINANNLSPKALSELLLSMMDNEQVCFNFEFTCTRNGDQNVSKLLRTEKSLFVPPVSISYDGRISYYSVATL